MMRPGLHWLACTVLPIALSVSACSAGGAQNSSQSPSEADENPAQAVASPEQMIEEYRLAREGTLSADEQTKIRNFMTSRGVAADAIQFFGRIVITDGDMYHYGDDVLKAASQLIQKGRVFDDINNADALPFCTLGGMPCPTNPVDIANPSGANLSWRRPDTTIKYYLIAPNGAPSYFLQLIGLAGSRITSALGTGSSGDCLNSTLFEAISLANYNALPAATKNSTYTIVFVRGDFGVVCGGGARGCSSGPRLQNVTVSGSSVSRLRFGHLIGLPTTPDPNQPEPDGITDDASNESVGVVIHEILHAMGIAHTSDSTAAVVPGTQQSSGADQFSSVMLANPEASTPSWANWSSAANIPPLDRTMLTKLYGGSSCGYSASFRTISP
jgi:hypothetical protein